MSLYTLSKAFAAKQQEQQNATVFNATLKEKLESLNRSTRPLPDIPSKKICLSAITQQISLIIFRRSAGWLEAEPGKAEDKHFRRDKKAALGCDGENPKLHGSDARSNDGASAALSSAQGSHELRLERQKSTNEHDIND